jgi:hypothetical protein
VSADTLLWAAIGVTVWAALLAAFMALGAAAKRGDEQLAAHYDALRTEDADATARPASPSELLAEAGRVLGAGRVALLAAGEGAGAVRVLACHPRRESDRAVDVHVVASALIGEAIVVAHTPPPIDGPERWAVQAVAVPVGQARANPGVLYLDGFPHARTLGAADRRFLVECAVGAAALIEPRFTRDPAPAARRQRPPAFTPQEPADAKHSNPPTVP